MIARETVLDLVLERRGSHRPPLRSHEDIVTDSDWFHEHDDLLDDDPDLAGAQYSVEFLEDVLSTLNAEITDATSKLVRRVRDLGGDTGAAEYGIYDGDDRTANAYCARIADLEEREKV